MKQISISNLEIEFLRIYVPEKQKDMSTQKHGTQMSTLVFSWNNQRQKLSKCPSKINTNGDRTISMDTTPFTAV